MKISSIRLGHATNSSSTHSILLNASLEEFDVPSNREYGWQDFHLKSRDAKAAYMMQQLWDNLQDIPIPYRIEIFKSMFNIDMNIDKKHHKYPEHGYVDHQGLFALPCSFNGKLPDLDFFNELKDRIVEDSRISIGGGNDNDEKTVNYDGTKIVTQVPRDYGHTNSNLVCRKDKDYWILFDQKIGTKIRLSLKDDAPAYNASTTPELVDVKITDFCPYNCWFCYQDSTKKGKHADKDNVNNILYKLGAVKTFEVAFGGGETTLHPNFKEFLHTCKYLGIVPNFTSFNMEWTKNQEIVNAVKECCGGIGISNHDEKVLCQMKIWNKDNNVKTRLQVPIGAYDQYITQHALKIAKALIIDVTLLGWKNHGRATKPMDDGKWIIDYLLDPINKYSRFGADTTFVAIFGKQLLEAGISERLMVGSEGKFSCYIDAVEMKMGACSYTNKVHDIDMKQLFGHFPYD